MEIKKLLKEIKKIFQYIKKNNNIIFKLIFEICNIFVFVFDKNIKLNLLIAIFGNLINQDFFLLIINKKFAILAI